MSSVVWEGEGEDPSAGGDPPQLGADAPDPAPPGSAVDAVFSEAQDVLEDDFKVLQVGKHRRLVARYRALEDDEREDLKAEAQQHHRLRERESGRGEGRKRKASSQKAHQAKLAAATERYFDALVLATACEEVLYVDDEGNHVPLQEIIGTQVPVAYDRTLAKWARLDELLGLNLDEAMPADVVTALHTFGRARSTAPLTTQAEVFKMWNAAVSADALESALGGI